MTANKLKPTWEWERILRSALDAEDEDRWVQRSKWDDLDNWLQDQYAEGGAKLPALKSLLEHLRTIVPTITIENGMERTNRHLSPFDGREDWMGHEHLRRAAEILYLGELEAVVEGEPPQLSDSWEVYRKMVEKHLAEYVTASEPTSGAKELSRRAHSSAALDLFANIDRVAGFAKHELSDEADHRWLTELVSEIAYSAYDAGRHTQAAWGKEFEKHASVRLKATNSLMHQTSGRDEANKRKSEEAKEKQAHARRVREQFCSGDQSAAADARRIHRNWLKIEGPSTLAPVPAVKTLQNWISENLI